MPPVFILFLFIDVQFGCLKMPGDFRFTLHCLIIHYFFKTNNKKNKQTVKYRLSFFQCA